MIYLALWVSSLAAAVLTAVWTLCKRERANRARPAWVAFCIFWVLLSLGFGFGQVALWLAMQKINYKTPHLASSALWPLAFLLVLTGVTVFGFKKKGEQRRLAAWSPPFVGLSALGAFVGYFGILYGGYQQQLKVVKQLREEDGQNIAALMLPRPADKDNAALVYQQAFAAMKTAFDKDKLKSRWARVEHLADFRAEKFDHQEPLLLEVLEKQKPALAMFRQAAAMPVCYFERPYTLPHSSIDLPELTQIRAGARLLGCSARVKAATGDVKGAFEELKAMEQIARHLCQDPMLLSALVGVGVSFTNTIVLDAILVSHPVNDETLAVWENIPIPFCEDVRRRAWMSERAIGLSTFLEILDPNDPTVGTMISSEMSFLTKLSFVRHYFAVYCLPQELEGFQAFWRELLAVQKDYGKEFHAIGERYSSRALRGSHGILISLAAPVNASTGVSFLRGEAACRLKRLARAACEYRIKTGALPEALDQLVPDYIEEVPLDPFDDQPLRMKKREAGGISFYSIGINMIDEDGAPSLKGDVKTGDVVLSIGSFSAPKN